MSSHFTLAVGEYPLMDDDDFIPEELFTIFQPEDKNIYKRKYSERSKMIWDMDGVDEDYEETAYEYKLKVKDAIERLDALGYSLREARVQFEYEVESWKRDIEEMRGQSNKTLAKKYPDYAKSRYYKTFDFTSLPKTYGYKQWEKSVKFVVENKIKVKESILRSAVNDLENGTRTLDDTIKSFKNLYINYQISDDYILFRAKDIKYSLRAILEICNPEEELIFDYTDLVEGGYIDPKDELSGPVEKVIIFTEGAKDTEIISKCIEILIPNLKNYYHFIDFDFVRAQGGAGHLVNIIKTLIGSGIQNKIIALFDNDSAAHEAISQLKLIQIPENIKVVTLPKIDLCKKYPTIGPTGIKKLNINGLASSIELFYGKDVLRDSKLGFKPIQWTGFVNKLNRYQGEITSKDEINKLFMAKISKNKNKIDPKSDWTEMNILLSFIKSIYK